MRAGHCFGLILIAVLGGMPAVAATNAEVADAYNKLPLSFEVNEGQAPPEVKFVSHASNYILLLSDAKADLVIQWKVATAEHTISRNTSNGGILSMRLIGGN